MDKRTYFDKHTQNALFALAFHYSFFIIHYSLFINYQCR